MRFFFCLYMTFFSLVGLCQPPAGKNWKLIWYDDFNSNPELDQNWDFQNGTNKNILSSRWRENASIANGILEMLNKKEVKGGKDFTSASLWTKKTFKYGYFEFRYKYGSSTGLNNSFWITNLPEKNADTIFEIDINEGHYPNEVATNFHRHKPLPHTSDSKAFRIGQESRPFVNIVLNRPIVSNKIKLVINDYSRSRIAELRVFQANNNGYPTLRPNGEIENNGGTQKNIALEGKASASSVYKSNLSADDAIDGDINTRWTSADSSSNSLIITFQKKYTIGCIQIISGWKQDKIWRNPIYNFNVQYWDGQNWVNIDNPDANSSSAGVDLSNEYHIYGLEWNESEMIWYFDGKEIRREANQFCKKEAHVFLSSAIINMGPVTDKINGTSMDVDYVRVYGQE